MRRPAIRPTGFSLVEVLVVLAVLGVLLGGLLVPLSTRMETARYERVAQQLDTARRALIGFAAANGNRLPCPDNDVDGLSDPPGAGSCDAVEGFLPYATLGLQELDPWGNRLRYRPDGLLTREAGLPPDTPEFEDKMEVWDLGDPAVLNDGLHLAAPTSVAAVLFSCGANGFADAENNGNEPTVTASAASARCAAPAAPLDQNYVQAPLMAQGFDDALIWLSVHSLAARLAAAGFWPR